MVCRYTRMRRKSEEVGTSGARMVSPSHFVSRNKLTCPGVLRRRALFVFLLRNCIKLWSCTVWNRVHQVLFSLKIDCHTRQSLDIGPIVDTVVSLYYTRLSFHCVHILNLKSSLASKNMALFVMRYVNRK